MKFPKYNFKKIPPQNSSYARDRTLCVYNLVSFFFFLIYLYEQKKRAHMVRYHCPGPLKPEFYHMGPLKLLGAIHLGTTF